MRRCFPDRRSPPAQFSRSTLALDARAGVHARTRVTANFVNIRGYEDGDGMGGEEMVTTPPELAKVRRRRRLRHYGRAVSAALGKSVTSNLAAFGLPSAAISVLRTFMPSSRS